MNWNWVTERLAVGSRPRTIDDVQSLAAAGITHILNVCDVDDAPTIAPAAWSDLKIEAYRFNPTVDDGEPKPVSWFADSLAFINPFLGSYNTRWLIHCYDGVDRSASTAYASLRALGFSRADAWLQIVKNRPITAAMRYCKDADAAIKELYGL